MCCSMTTSLAPKAWTAGFYVSSVEHPSPVPTLDSFKLACMVTALPACQLRLGLCITCEAQGNFLADVHGCLYIAAAVCTVRV